MSAIVRAEERTIVEINGRSKESLFDRFLSAVAPRLYHNRQAHRTAAKIIRSYEATAKTRRTEGWVSAGSSANTASAGQLAFLRNLARDLYRNNGWAIRGADEIVNNTIGWGIQPRSKSAQHIALWKAWGGKTSCHAANKLTVYGIESLVLHTIVLSGECLIRRRTMPTRSGIPLRLEVLEPDCIDSTKNQDGPGLNRIFEGVEVNSLGEPVAYWLHKKHPGDSFLVQSERVSAEDVIHAFDVERPGQLRGPSWLAAAIVTLQDFDDYEDAVLMRQKIAACFAAFVTNLDGAGVGLDDSTDEFESLEPGAIVRLNPGDDVKFGTPPPVTDNDAFSKTALRRIAASLGVTYEGLTGDYSQVNFSSARMARLTHYGNVHHWRWNMMIPQVCERIWEWFEDAAIIAGKVAGQAEVSWTPPPMPMIEPDREGKAYRQAVRAGQMTHKEMIAEMGNDPETFFDEYKEGLDEIDKRGIVLDSDARKTTDAGQLQQEPMTKAPGGQEKNA